MSDARFAEALLTLSAVCIRVMGPTAVFLSPSFNLIRLLLEKACALCPQLPAPHSALAFGLKLLRGGTLHCFSRQLAAATDDLLRQCPRPQLVLTPSHPGQPMQSQPMQSQPRGGPGEGDRPTGHAPAPAAPAPAGPAATAAHDRQSEPGSSASISELNSALGLSYVFQKLAASVVDKACYTFLECNAGPAGARSTKEEKWRHNGPYVRQLAAALRDSGVLEHAARAAILHVLAEPGAIRTAGVRRSAFLLLKAANTLTRAAGSPLAAAEPRAASDLRAALSGPCMRHLVMAAAVAVLCQADGGPDYGTPTELLRALTYSAGAGGGTGLSATDVMPVAGGDILAFALQWMLDQAEAPEAARVRLPGRRACGHLALRIGRMGLAAQRAWAGEEEGPGQPEPAAAGAATAEPAAPDTSVAEAEAAAAAGQSQLPASGSTAQQPPLGAHTVANPAALLRGCRETATARGLPPLALRRARRPMPSREDAPAGVAARTEADANPMGPEAAAAASPVPRPASADPQPCLGTRPAARHPDPVLLRRACGWAEARALMPLALRCARRWMVRREDAPGRSAAEGEWWGLAVATLRYMAERASARFDAGCMDLKECAVAEEARLRAPLGSLLGADGTLRKEPPPHVSAALSCGLTQLYETHLRRSATNAALSFVVSVHLQLKDASLQHMLKGYWQEEEEQVAAAAGTRDSALLPAAMLAYGNPTEVAALLVSLAKLTEPDMSVETIRIHKVSGFRIPQAATHAAARFLLASDGWLAELTSVPEQPGQPLPTGPTLQLVRLVSFALWYMLPRLSRVLRSELDRPELEALLLGQSGNWNRFAVAQFPAVFRWVPHLARLAAAEEAAAAGALGRSGGAGSSAAASAAMQFDLATGRGGWRALLLSDMSAVELLGAAMRTAPALLQRGLWDAAAGRDLAEACAALAAACPAEVQAAVREAAAAAGTAGSGKGTGRGGGRRRGTHTGEADSSDPPAWHPRWGYAALQALQGAGQREGSAEAAMEALVARMDEWGGGGGGRSGGYGGRKSRGVGPLQQRTADHGICRLLAAAPPAEARRLLRTCANPVCANLTGDSEAGLPLKACSKCGAVEYCGRACQVAHWRSGHMEACAAMRRAAGEM